MILPRERLNSYLNRKNRNAASLLAAASICKDAALRQEARRLYPDDPRVLLDSLLRNELSHEERGRALELIRKTEPDNSLADYLLAKECFEQGNADGGIDALCKGCAKPLIDGHVQEMVQEREEAYRDAGYSLDQAAGAAHWGAELLQVKQPLVDLSKLVLAMREGYVEAGDANSARLLALMGSRMGEQMQLQTGTRFIIDDLVALSVESRFLAVMSPAEQLVAGGQTAGDRLAELNRQKVLIKDLTHNVAPPEALPPSVKIEFFRQMDIGGELEAFRWLKSAGY